MNLQEEPLAKVITPKKIDYEAEGLVQCEGITYSTYNGREYKMDIVYPARAEGGLPVVVWVHGGGWSDEKLTRKYLPSVELAELSGRGYTTVSIDYRLSQAAPFPAQIEDCKAAVRFLRANAQKYHVDPERIAAWGESAGGHLVELMAYTAEEEFRNDCYPSFSASIQAVIPWYAPDDLRMDCCYQDTGGRNPLPGLQIPQICIPEDLPYPQNMCKSFPWKCLHSARSY